VVVKSGKQEKREKGNKYAFFINLGYLIILAGLIALVALALLSLFKIGDKVVFDSLEPSFALILAGLGVFFTATVLLPKFLLQTEVNNGLNDMFPDKIDELIKPRLDDLSNEIKRTDAHLSRMIALFLNKDKTVSYNIWALGWCFRSLNRYSSLDPKKTGIDEYKDFIDMIQTILQKSMGEFTSKIKNNLSIQIQDIGNDYINDFLECVGSQVKDESYGEVGDELRTAFRAFKDIFDFEFSISDSRKINPEMNFCFRNISRSIGIFAQILFLVYANNIKHELNKKIKNIEELEKVLQDTIFHNIMAISKYGNRCDDKDIRLEFEKTINESVKRILAPDEQKRLIKLFGKVYCEQEGKHEYIFLEKVPIKS
jgi:hypothetical protein